MDIINFIAEADTRKDGFFVWTRKHGKLEMMAGPEGWLLSWRCGNGHAQALVQGDREFQSFIAFLRKAKYWEEHPEVD